MIDLLLMSINVSVYFNDMRQHPLSRILEVEVHGSRQVLELKWNILLCLFSHLITYISAELLYTVD